MASPFDVQVPAWLRQPNPSEFMLQSQQSAAHLGSNLLNGMRVGMQMKEDAELLPLKVAQIKLDNEKKTLDATYRAQVNVAEGEIAKVIATQDPSTPEYLKAIGEVGTRYPAVMQSPVWLHGVSLWRDSNKLQNELTKIQGVSDANAVKADIAQSRADLAGEKLDLERAKADKEKLPTDVQVAQWRSNTLNKISDAKAKGDDATVSTLQNEVDFVDSKASKGMRISFDENGKPIIETGGKTARDINQPTVGTATQNQQKLARYENVTELLSGLQQNLKPTDVGAAGVVGEFVLDRTLAQLPGMDKMASQGRIQNRTALQIARESLMREINNDSRFSNADREEIGKALPSNGVFESYKDAMTRIKTVKDILGSRGKVYGTQMGMKVPPLFTMSPEEIKAAVQAKEITVDQAADALRRFHGFK